MTGPTLRIAIGTAGSGKSTITQRLAREHGAAYLDKDVMSARFVEAALPCPTNCAHSRCCRDQHELHLCRATGRSARRLRLAARGELVGLRRQWQSQRAIAANHVVDFRSAPALPSVGCRLDEEAR